MLTTLKARTATIPAWQLRILRIVFFTALTALFARVRIELPGNPVPITGQTLAVWMAGMALGSVDGMLSQLVYVGLIALGAPLDTRGLGSAVFIGATAGYLVGFIPGAFVAGLAHGRAVALNVICGIGGVLIVHSLGTLGVAMSQKLDWSAAALLGSAPFIILDCGKVLLAASLVKLGMESRVRWG